MDRSLQKKDEYTANTAYRLVTVNLLKFGTPKKKEHPKFIFLSSSLKQREVTNFAKGGNLIASLCKIGYFSQ